MSRPVRRRLDALSDRLRGRNPLPEMPADVRPLALETANEAVARLEARAAAGEAHAARKLTRVHALLAIAAQRRDAAGGHE